jgi:hypothetical protein
MAVNVNKNFLLIFHTIGKKVDFNGLVLSLIIVPDRRCWILKVVLVRRLVTWVLGIWRGEGLGKGVRKGRSVYKQPETEADGSCHSKEGSK